MSLVELWTIGKADSNIFNLIEPYLDRDTIDVNGYTLYKKSNGWVVNGCYNVIRYKDENKLTICYPAEKFDIESHYLGDVQMLPDKDGVMGYNLTIVAYEDTRKVLGKNIIELKPIPKEATWSNRPDEDPAF